MNEIDQLADALERFIFHKEELREIGRLILQLQEGICTVDKLKSKILESRVRILNDITEFTKFFISHIDLKASERIISQDIKRDLEEKNSLLTEIARRLLTMTLEHNPSENYNNKK